MFKIESVLSLIFLSLFFNGAVIAKEDARKPITLSEDERNLVLEEMRTFLDMVRSITVSLSKDDMASIATSTNKVGMASAAGVPAALTNKLPLEFKKLGMKTHKAFDQLGLDAVDMGDKQQLLEQLGTLMGNCVACHALYRLPEPK